MGINSAENAHRLGCNIQSFQGKVDKVQTQIANLASTMKTLDMMGTTIDREARLEANEAVLARACILQDPEFNKNLTNLEKVIGDINAANDALQNDSGMDFFLEEQLKHYTQYQNALGWIGLLKNTYDTDVLKDNIGSYYSFDYSSLNSITTHAAFSGAVATATATAVTGTNTDSLEKGMLVLENGAGRGIITEITDATSFKMDISTEFTTGKDANGALYFVRNVKLTTHAAFSGATATATAVTGTNTDSLEEGMLVLENGAGRGIITEITDATSFKMDISAVFTTGKDANGALYFVRNVKLTTHASFTGATATATAVTGTNTRLLEKGMLVLETGAGRGIITEITDATSFKMDISAVFTTGKDANGALYITNTKHIVDIFYETNGACKSVSSILKTKNDSFRNLVITPTNETSLSHTGDYNQIRNLYTSYSAFLKSKQISRYRYKTSDADELIKIISNPPVDVNKTIMELKIKIEDEKQTDNYDKNLVADMTKALTAYKALDVVKLNDSLNSCIVKCTTNVAPYKCECFTTLSFAKTDLYQKTKTSNAVDDLLLSTAADDMVSYTNNCKQLVDGEVYTSSSNQTDTTKTGINKLFSKYLEDLYKNADLIHALYRLYDDSSVTQIPDAMTKIKKITSQM
jgi:hypothetical protein